MSGAPDRGWRQVELEARADALAGLEDFAPMPTGTLIAWSQHRFGGTTDGFSPVHRVGDSTVTLCGEEIPAAIRRVPVALVRSLGRCRYCEAKYGKQEHAA